MIAVTILALAIVQPHPHAPVHHRTLAQATPAPIMATPTPLASDTPTAAPATPARVTPTATVVATPSVSPYGYRFVPRQPAHPAPGEPQIFAVYLNEKKLRSKGPIRIKVETSHDVVKVVSRSNGREGNLVLVAAGDFEATSVLPKIPFIAAGMSVDLEFVAIGADGRRTSVRVPVTLN